MVMAVRFKSIFMKNSSSLSFSVYLFHLRQAVCPVTSPFTLRVWGLRPLMAVSPDVLNMDLLECHSPPEMLVCQCEVFIGEELIV